MRLKEEVHTPFTVESGNFMFCFDNGVFGVQKNVFLTVHSKKINEWFDT